MDKETRPVMGYREDMDKAFDEAVRIMVEGGCDQKAALHIVSMAKERCGWMFVEADIACAPECFDAFVQLREFYTERLSKACGTVIALEARNYFERHGNAPPPAPSPSTKPKLPDWIKVIEGGKA
jgi:hypothetical protein